MSAFYARWGFLDLLRIKWWSLQAQEHLGGRRAHALEPASEVLDALADKPLRVYRELEGARDVTWLQVAGASRSFRPHLVPLQSELECWAATYHLQAEPLVELAFGGLALWSWHEPSLRRRDLVPGTTYMDGGMLARVQKPQTPDRQVWAVLSQVLGRRSEQIAKWHNEKHHPPQHERAKRHVTAGTVRDQVHTALSLIGLPARKHVGGRPKKA